MIIGALLTSFFCTCFVLLGFYISRNVKFKLKRAYKHNCVANAEMTKHEYDENNSLRSCVYEYEYRGETYYYQKFHFSEKPLPKIKLFWEEGHAEEPMEIADMHSDYNGITKLAIITAAASLIVALFLPQLPLIFGSITVFCFYSKDHLAAKFGIAASIFAILVSSILWVSANVDPLAYEDVSYDINQHYPEIRAQLSIIDTLNELQICELYDDVTYANMDINEGREGRKVPVFGQFVNKHWADMEPFEWPTGYEKYTSWEYRSDVYDQHYDW